LRYQALLKQNADMPLFPILVKIKARKCLVVGAGKIATAKAAGLLSHGAEVLVVSPRATEWIRAQADGGKLTWERRNFADSDVEGAFLVVAATNSNSTNEAVFRACQARSVLCNVVDEPERCDFFYPAIVRRGPLQIAISTGGRSPGLARRLRTELERQFGPEYGEWVEYVGEMRKQTLSRQLDKDERDRLLDQIASRESFESFVQQRGSAKVQGKGDGEADC
jgi:precorrin-2 dehydrogenase / sirohydrochlorin ferrochelatase